MAVSPVLIIKTIENSVVSVRVRLYDDFSQHEIVLNSVLTYWWANNLPPAIKFLELLESVIKRTINEVMPHKSLNIKYEVKADHDLEKASFIEINIIEVEADLGIIRNRNKNVPSEQVFSFLGLLLYCLCLIHF